MFCQKCGKENPDSNQFCGACGENLFNLYENHEQTKNIKNTKKRKKNFGIVIVGIFSLLIGGLIIFYINVFPVASVLGHGITIAQMDSLCSNIVVGVLSRGSCNDVHTQFVLGWIIGLVLIITGIFEIFSR
jgi:hypothetical protein